MSSRLNKQPQAGPAEYPSNRNIYFYSTLILSFITSFTLYLMTLAPTVTFEDSGELTTAAYLLGIPHQPGYPLFTLLGKVFTFLPIGNIAYRLNLMSAFFSSLGSLLLTWSIILMIEDCFRGTSLFQGRTPGSMNVLKYTSALAAGILKAVSFENWEQSIITEVYGLHAMFVGLLILLAVLWRRQMDDISRKRYFYAVCFVIGLSLSNHITSLVLIPTLFLFALIENRKFIMNVKLLLKGSFFLLLGLTPYIYLPIASARNPLMDWGNPENATNFLRTITRHQYGYGQEQTLKKFLAESATYFNLLTQQWAIVFLIFACIGLIVLFKYKRTYFAFSLIFLFFNIPVITWLTDFDVTLANKIVVAENTALVSVFYIPSYIYLAGLMGIGIFYLASLVKVRKPLIYGLGFLIVAIPLASSYSNYKKLDMSKYYFAEDYVNNLFQVVTKNAVVFTDWDPFYFPLNYYQFVENRRTDVIALDQMLLRRSWYIQWLKDHYPELIESSKKEVEEFLEAVAPFENREPYDGYFIQKKYIAMVNAIIDHSIESGRDVYLTYPPSPEVAPQYFKEPVIIAFRLITNPGDISPVDIGTLKFRNFFNSNVPLDRMAKAFRDYYGSMFLSRGQLIEKNGDLPQALTLYKKSREFMSRDPRILPYIDASIQRIQGKLSR